MADDIAPFRLVAKLRNNRMIRLREALGFSSAAAFCRAHSDIVHTTYCRYESLQESPWSDHQHDWHRLARRIASALGTEPEYIWPEVVLAVKKTEAIREVQAAEVMQMMAPAARTPEDHLLASETTGAVLGSLILLPERTRFCIERAMGLDGEEAETYGEIGEQLRPPVGRERVRQIVEHGLATIRATLHDKDHEP